MITKKIDWLIEKPIEKTLKRTLLFGIILLVVTAPVVIQMLESTNFPGTLDETQLGFNGEYIRECFSTMTEKDISNFILANIVDYFFMISYAAMLTRHLLNTADFVPLQQRILAERREAWIN